MISIVVPIFNEEENIVPLYQELNSVLKKIGDKYEIIFVNDGSRDKTQEVARSVFRKDTKHVRVIQFRHNFGKAAALRAGFQAARGEIIITLDGDLQDVPSEIPKFLKQIEKGYDLVSGWRKERKDSFAKNSASKIFNLVTNYISKVKLHDFNCGFKAYRVEVAKGLNLYGELHRYIPVIAAAEGFAVSEIAIKHRKRKFGRTKYGALRFVHGFLDLLTVC